MNWRSGSKLTISPFALTAIVIVILLISPSLKAEEEDALSRNVNTVQVTTENTTGITPGTEAQALKEEQNRAKEIAKTSKNALTAAPTPECGKTEISCAIILLLNWIADFFIYLIFPLGEAFFNAVISISFTFTNPNDQFAVATNIGWNIVLGVMNMFFVLVLLWIAIATIFDFEPFTARSLLPKLIIAALLINFSLPIGRSIINLSNGVAAIFLNQINEKMGGVAGAVSQIFSPEAITLSVQNKYTTMDPAEAKKILTESRVTITPGVSLFNILPTIRWPGTTTYTAEQCYQKINSTGAWLTSWITGGEIYKRCSAFLTDVRIARAVSTIDPNYGKVTLLAGAFVAKMFVAPIALFAIFAAGVMLLIRIISLSMLLIFGPFAFFGLILPYTQSYWNMWWEKLFRWSFFMPVFSFLFMLSLMVIQQIPSKTKELILAGEAAPDIGILFVNYLIGIGLMIGALMVGNQMGIAGASTVTGWGRKMAGAAGGYVKARGWKYGGKGADRFMESGIGKAISRIPVLGAGVRYAATATMKKGVGVEKKDMEFYSKLPDRQLVNVLSTMSQARAAAIWRSLPPKRKRGAEPKLAALARSRGWEKAPPEPVSMQAAIQNQVMPIIQNAIRNLPQDIQNAITQATQQAIQNLPADATLQAATQAVQQAVQTMAQNTPANINLGTAVTLIRDQTAQIQAAAERAQQAAGRAPHTVREDLEEAVEELKGDVEELRGRQG